MGALGVIKILSLSVFLKIAITLSGCQAFMCPYPELPLAMVTMQMKSAGR